MRKVLAVAGAVVAAAAVTAVAVAAAPAPPTANPFPAATVGPVFIAAYAVDVKSHKVLAAKDVKYFYVSIPNQPNLKLKFDPKAPGASGQMTWTGTWREPRAS